MAHDEKACGRVGGCGDEDRDQGLMFSSGTCVGGVAGDETDAIAAAVGEGEEDHLLKGTGFGAEERFDDVFGGFVDLVYEGNMDEKPIAHFKSSVEDVFPSDKTEKPGEEDEADEDRDLTDDLGGKAVSWDVFGGDADEADKRFREEINDEMDDPEGDSDREESNEAREEILLHSPMMKEKGLFAQASRRRCGAAGNRPLRLGEDKVDPLEFDEDRLA